jgi:hypothetical protein
LALALCFSSRNSHWPCTSGAGIGIGFALLERGLPLALYLEQDLALTVYFWSGIGTGFALLGRELPVARYFWNWEVFRGISAVPAGRTAMHIGMMPVESTFGAPAVGHRTFRRRARTRGRPGEPFWWHSRASAMHVGLAAGGTFGATACVKKVADLPMNSSRASLRRPTLTISPTAHSKRRKPSALQWAERDGVTRPLGNYTGLQEVFPPGMLPREKMVARRPRSGNRPGNFR